MIIINADDWGRTQAETDAALLCHRRLRITSVSAMVFMEDSRRAAELALREGIDVGLHLNLTQPFTALDVPLELREEQVRVARYLRRRRVTGMLFNPFLHDLFGRTYEAQRREFARLYGRSPSHVDGHHHMHLCANMLWGGVIPAGSKLRRTFHFWPGEKGRLQRAYRGLVNRTVSRRYRSTDYFFALSQSLSPDRFQRVLSLAADRAVELMVHPVDPKERERLLADDFLVRLAPIVRGSYATL